MRIRLEFAVRGVIIAVAVAAGLAIIDSQILHAGLPISLAVSALVAGLFALGAMRHPCYFLAIAVLLWAALPTVYDSSAHDLFVGCYQGGWCLGAITGKIMRRCEICGAVVPNAPEPMRAAFADALPRGPDAQSSVTAQHTTPAD